MMKCLAALLLALPAHAGPVASWGTSSAVLTRCDVADACVTVRNELSSAPDVVDAVLDLDGLTVAVRIEMGPGDAPDVVTVTVPLGFRVEPQTATVPEGAMVRFRVYFPMMG